MKNTRQILMTFLVTALLTVTTAITSFCQESIVPNSTTEVDYPEGILQNITSKNGRDISVIIDEKTFRLNQATKMTKCGKPEENIDFLYEFIGEDIAYFQTDSTGSLSKIMAICK